MSCSMRSSRFSMMCAGMGVSITPGGEGVDRRRPRQLAGERAGQPRDAALGGAVGHVVVGTASVGDGTGEEHAAHRFARQLSRDRVGDVVGVLEVVRDGAVPERLVLRAVHVWLKDTGQMGETSDMARLFDDPLAFRKADEVGLEGDEAVAGVRMCRRQAVQRLLADVGGRDPVAGCKQKVDEFGADAAGGAGHKNSAWAHDAVLAERAGICHMVWQCPGLEPGAFSGRNAL